MSLSEEDLIAAHNLLRTNLHCHFYIISAMINQLAICTSYLEALVVTWIVCLFPLFELFGSMLERYSNSFRCEAIFHRHFT